MVKKGGESMQRSLLDELKKHRVNEAVVLKAGDILVSTSEDLPCNFVFHVACKYSSWSSVPPYIVLSNSSAQKNS